MFRNPDSHLTLAVTHADADPRTVMADAERVPADAGYQFGASGA